MHITEWYLKVKRCPELTVRATVAVESENDDLCLSVTVNSEWPGREGDGRGGEEGL